MKGKGKICRIDDWDKPEAVKGKSWSHQERLCDLREKVSLHKKGDIYYISQFTRSKTGTSFSEIKQSEELASFFAERACEFLHRFIVGGCEGWCIVTTPRRRHYEGFHLRPIKEKKIIVYDDILTTGSTLLATYELLKDREQLLFLVGINNN